MGYKYIKSFETFKNIDNKDTLNEEFIGKLFKGIKNKLSLGFSKMFGSAKKVDKLMEEYKSELLKAQEQKKEALKKYGEYIKSEEKVDKDVDELKSNVKKATNNFEKEVGIIKKKFDIRFDEIVREEENKKIKNFIRLKKLEMQQDILRKETSSMLNDTGLSEEDAMSDPFFKKLIDDIEDKINNNTELQKKNKRELEEKEKENKYDLDKAKEMAKEDEVYIWKESPYIDKEFNEGDKIIYFSKQNMDKTNAKVKSDQDELVEVETKESKDKKETFKINKNTIIELVE